MVFNARGIPLTYLIRKLNSPVDNVITIDDKIDWNSPLHIPAFNIYSNTLVILLE